MMYGERPVASPSSAFAVAVWCWALIGYGLGLVIGGWQRFSKTGYYAISQIDGAPYVVGGALILAGLTAFAGQQWLIRPLFVGGIWAMIIICLALMGSIIYSALLVPTAGWGLSFIFGAIATHLWVLVRMETRKLTR